MPRIKPKGGTDMRKMIINKSYDAFSVSHKAFIRLRELGQQEALQETDRGAYWPASATPREPSLNQCGKLIHETMTSWFVCLKSFGKQPMGMPPNSRSSQSMTTCSG